MKKGSGCEQSLPIHTSAWNVVQELDEQVGRKEICLAEKAREHKGTGEIESKVLFEEQDGVYPTQQSLS